MLNKYKKINHIWGKKENKKIKPHALHWKKFAREKIWRRVLHYT